MSHHVILRLGEGEPAAGAADAHALRALLHETFGALAEVLAACECPTLPDVLHEVARCRSELAAGASLDAVDPQARACVAAVHSLAAAARDRAAERRTQVATLLGMVRETVATVGGDQAKLEQTLAGSAERFERLAHTDDLQRIQAQLFEEVSTLKRLATERRAAWEQTRQDLGSRLSTLETQLDHTRREAAVDPLTDVANRRTFERACLDWLAPDRPGFVLAMADVDDFKRINDQYGHPVGDRVLAAVAETLEQSLRAGDLVARLGGDEFAVLASRLTIEQAERRFAAIGRAVQEACRAVVPGGDAPSLSIGVAERSAGDTPESLQQRADTALYAAKRGGKGRVATKTMPLIRDLLRGKARA